MLKFYFRDGYEGGTPIPKVMWWYMIASHDTTALNAAKCNELYNNQLRDFFERYPEELYNKIDVDFVNQKYKTNITDEDVALFKKEIKIDEKKEI